MYPLEIRKQNQKRWSYKAAAERKEKDTLLSAMVSPPYQPYSHIQ
jgi:hypothetical protein